MSGGPVLPAYVTAPICVALLAAVIVHLVYLAPRVRPPSRRRIRSASGLVLVVAIPLVFVGFSVIAPGRRPGIWALTWIAASGLTALAAMLAVLDVVNTIRLHRRSRRSLRGELDRLRSQWSDAGAAASANADATADSARTRRSDQTAERIADGRG